MKLFGLVMVLCSESQVDPMIGQYYDSCDSHMVAVYDVLDDCTSMVYALSKLPGDVVPRIDCEETTEEEVK